MHVRNASCSTHIIAVYIPPEDMEARNLIYNYIQQVAGTLDLTAHKERSHMIIMPVASADVADTDWL
jgi:hypothetical protein